MELNSGKDITGYFKNVLFILIHHCSAFSVTSLQQFMVDPEPFMGTLDNLGAFQHHNTPTRRYTDYKTLRAPMEMDTWKSK